MLLVGIDSVKEKINSFMYHYCKLCFLETKPGFISSLKKEIVKNELYKLSTIISMDVKKASKQE